MSTRCIRTTTALLLLLAVAVSVPAQSLDDLLDRSAFSPTEREEIADLIAAAEDAGVPDALLVPRLAEGLAKGVPYARVLSALRGEVSSLLDARAFLREIDAAALIEDEASWARAANLLDTTLSDGAIGVLARASAPRPQTFRPATGLLVSLVDWGLEEAEAASLAAGAAVSGLDPADYPVVVDILAEGRIRRLDVADIVERLLETLPEATSARNLRRLVLR